MTNYDRLPPQNLDAERSVIGAMLLNNEVIPLAAEVLPTHEAFYSEVHRLIYKAILYIHGKDDPSDVVTVMEMLNTWGKLEACGGPAYIADLSGAVPTSANVTNYAEIVKKAYMLREWIAAGTRTVDEAYALPEDPEGFLGQSVEELSNIALGMIQRKGSTPSELKYGYDAWIGKMASLKEGDKPGLLFGLPCLDRILLTGLERDIVFIAGRPSTGKSSLALNFIFNNAKLGIEGLLFSLEDSKEDIVRRLGHIVCPHEEFMGYVARGSQKARYDLLRAHQNAVERISVLIRDDLKFIEDIILAARAAISKHRAYAYIIIDYLQIVHTRIKGMYDAKEVIDRVLSVIGMAKGTLGDRPIIILTQITRDKFVDKKYGPQLEGMKGSGKIEETADVVIILHQAEDQEGDPNITRIRCTVAKARDGPVRATHLNFAKPMFTFYDPKTGRDIDPKQQELVDEDEVPF